MQEKRAETGLVSIETIGVKKATELRDLGVEIAREMGLSGFLVVYNSVGLQECSQVVGNKAMLQNVAIGLDKIKTVLSTRRSTSIQRERMKANGYSREDFAGELGSLFGGGVAIFADETHIKFVGAIAFSGGKPEEDEEICRKAVEKAGLFTDLPKILEDPETIAIEENLFLKRIISEDSEAMFALIDKNRDHLSQFGDETAKKYPTLESVKERNSTQSSNEKRFGIWDKDKFIGFVKLTLREGKGWEIGYWMGAEYTGKGYMTKAVLALSILGVDNLGASFVFAKVNKENMASIRVLTRAGYQFKGANPEDESELIFEFKK